MSSQNIKRTAPMPVTPSLVRKSTLSTAPQKISRHNSIPSPPKKSDKLVAKAPPPMTKASNVTTPSTPSTPGDKVASAPIRKSSISTIPKSISTAVPIEVLVRQKAEELLLRVDEILAIGKVGDTYTAYEEMLRKNMEAKCQKINLKADDEIEKLRIQIPLSRMDQFRKELFKIEYKRTQNLYVQKYTYNYEKADKFIIAEALRPAIKRLIRDDKVNFNGYKKSCHMAYNQIIEMCGTYLEAYAFGLELNVYYEFDSKYFPLQDFEEIREDVTRMVTRITHFFVRWRRMLNAFTEEHIADESHVQRMKTVCQIFESIKNDINRQGFITGYVPIKPNFLGGKIKGTN